MNSDRPASGIGFMVRRFLGTGPFRHLVADSAKLYVTQVFSLVTGLGIAIIISRVLGPEKRGIYVWMMALSGIASQLSMLGMDSAWRKMAGENPKLVPTLIGNSVWLSLIGGTIISLVLGLIALRYPIAHENKAALFLALTGAPFIVLSTAFSSLMVALGRMKRTTLIVIIPRVLTLVLLGMVIAAAWISVEASVALMTVSAIAGMLTGLHGLKDLVANPLRQPWRHLASVWRYVASIYIASLLFFVVQKITLLLIGIYLGAADSGYYGTASSLLEMMIMLPATIAFILTPKLSGMTDPAERKYLKKQAYMILFILMGVGSLAAAALGKFIITLLFGDAFLPAVLPFQYLCAAAFTVSFYFIAQCSLVATGRGLYVIAAPFVALLTNCLLCVILIPYHGIIGASVSTIIAYAAATLTALFLDWRSETASLRQFSQTNV